MSEYIKREDAIKRLCDFSQEGTIPMPYELWENVLKAVPSADVVETVRCKDCRYYDNKNCKEGFGYCMREQEDGLYYNALHGVFKDNDYCSYGERKDGDKE